MTGPSIGERRARLRELLSDGELHVTPGVTNAFYALLAEEAGLDAVFVTGGGVANSLLGAPDIGLTTMTETVEVVRRVAGAVGVPVIADADTGYGNHLNTFRTVAELERAGAAGLTLEDQVAPKRCGHFAGKSVVACREMVEKLVAARHASDGTGLVIVARTDALAVEGLDGALRRARAYVAAGADAIFVEAPRDLAELEAIPSAVGAPCVVNMVEGGTTPLVGAGELAAMGYSVALYANLALRMAARGVQRAFAALAADGDSAALIGEMFSWEKRQTLVGHQWWLALDEEIATAAREVLARVEMEAA